MKSPPPPTSVEDDEQRLLILPYVKGLSETIRLVCRPLNIKTAFRSSSTLRSLLTHVKAPTPQTNRRVWCTVSPAIVVYRVPCDCGSVHVSYHVAYYKDLRTSHKSPFDVVLNTLCSMQK